MKNGAIFAVIAAVASLSIVFVPDAYSAPRKKGGKGQAKLTVAAAVESAALGMGAEYDAAQAFLKADTGGLGPRKGAVESVLSKFPGDTDVARRLMDMVSGFDAEGCAYAAGLVSRNRPAWVGEILKRYPGAMRCDALDRAMAAIPEWAPDPESSREAELFAIDVAAALRHAGNRAGALAACQWLYRGPSNVRVAAADLIAAVRPEKGLNCLVKAFDRDKNGENRAVAGEFLDAIARFGGDSAFPHLLNAFENVNHFEKACDVVVRSGDPGLKTLVRAVRAVSGRDPLLMECLSRHAALSRGYVLPLLGDRSREIRKFALAFFTRNQFPEALERFKSGFRLADSSVVPEIPREDLFEAMASYPVEDISDMVLLALTDNDDRIRDRGLELIKRRKSLVFADAVRTVAETDPNRVSRTFALNILWMLADFGAEPLVRRMAQYEESGIANEATRILGYIGSQESIDVLRRLARTHQGQPRGIAALKSLAFLGLTLDPMKASFVNYAEPKLKSGDGPVTCGRFQAHYLGGSGPLLLALPGGPGMDSRWARPWLDELGRRAMVAWVDPVDPETTSDAVLTAQDFDCFVEAFGREQAVLVAEGLGGTSAMWLAFQAPGKVAGLVTISSSLPGRVDTMDQVLLRSLPQPFDSFAAELIERAGEFRSEAIDFYLLKALAAGLGGGVDAAADVMRLRYDTGLLNAARAELSRSEVRFTGMEVDRPALWILPGELMTAEEMEPYRALVAERPGKYRIFEIDGDCGVSPGVSCPKVLQKQIRRFVEDLR